MTETVTNQQQPISTDEPFGPARRGRGVLEAQVREVIDDFVTGVLDAEDMPITAHRVSNLVRDRHLESKRPSTGAVSAIFARWSVIGAAVIGNDPIQFLGYTLDASEVGFRELNRLYKERNGL